MNCVQGSCQGGYLNLAVRWVKANHVYVDIPVINNYVGPDIYIYLARLSLTGSARCVRVW